MADRRRAGGRRADGGRTAGRRRADGGRTAGGHGRRADGGRTVGGRQADGRQTAGGRRADGGPMVGGRRADGGRADGGRRKVESGGGRRPRAGGACGSHIAWLIVSTELAQCWGLGQQGEASAARRQRGGGGRPPDILLAHGHPPHVPRRGPLPQEVQEGPAPPPARRRPPLLGRVLGTSRGSGEVPLGQFRSGSTTGAVP